MEPANNPTTKNNPITKDSTEKLPAPVYYVESPNDDTVLVALDVTIKHRVFDNKDNILVSWFDTAYDRNMEASEIIKQGDNFAFKRSEQEGGGVYSFTPMNLELYYNKVKSHLIAGSDFTNQEDMINAFQRTTKERF